MEPITSLLDAFIKLAERLINLEKTKLQDKKELFNEIAKPLFEDLEPVAANYMEIFRKIRKIINKRSLPKIRNLVWFVVEERETMLIARSKVNYMAYQISEHIRDDEVNAFTDAVRHLFYKTTEDHQSRTKEFLSELNQIEANVEATGKISKEDKTLIAIYVDDTLVSLEQCWNEIVQSYEKLKIYSVSSPKYIRKNQSKMIKPQ